MSAPDCPKGSPSALPDVDQSLALRAILLDGGRAIKAWEELSKRGGTEALGIEKIAPLLMASLERLAPHDPWVKARPDLLARAREEGRTRTDFAQSIIECLIDAGVSTMALKGLALGATVYPSPGFRRVADIDLLVPGKDVFRAIEALRMRGFDPAPGAPKEWADLRRGHAHVFHNGKCGELSLDLHWHVLASARADDDDDFFWSGAERLAIGGVETKALCPEDQLFHVLVHGVRWTRTPHVRWVVDAVMLLRRHGKALRMSRFVEAIERFDAVAPVQHGLQFVVTLLGEGNEFFERVQKIPCSRFAELAFAARATAHMNRSVAQRVALRIEEYLWSHRSNRASTAPGLLGGPAGGGRA